MMIAMFSLVCAYYIVADLIPLYNAKQRKTFWIYLILIAFAYCLWLLVAMDVKLTSPSGLIRKAVTAVFRL